MTSRPSPDGQAWPTTSVRTLRRAWWRALYGPDGFYRRPEGPAGHFRTPSHVPGFASALARLAGLAGCRRVLDVGAGRGELLRALARHAPELELAGVEVVPRPPGLPAAVRWHRRLPDRMDDTLLVAVEWLDVVPCPVLQADRGGRLRVVRIGADGRERPGGPPRPADLAWSRRWWPPAVRPEPGTRVEVGRTRDLAWAGAVSRISGGLALMVDYGHLRARRPVGGTLRSYAAGRAVPVVFDGTADLSADVALDAVADAGAAAAAGVGRTGGTWHTTLGQALRELGATRASAGARGTPISELQSRAARSLLAELLDAGGFGGFGWVLHAVGRPLPTPVGRPDPSDRDPSDLTRPA